ncbi:hypothetical protein NHX12_003445, partial [Muraenolepis orangiensis]
PSSTPSPPSPRSKLSREAGPRLSLASRSVGADPASGPEPLPSGSVAPRPRWNACLRATVLLHGMGVCPRDRSTRALNGRSVQSDGLNGPTAQSSSVVRPSSCQFPRPDYSETK